MKWSQPSLLILLPPLIHTIICSDTGEIIQNLTQNKAPGHEGIKNIWLKNLKIRPLFTF
jgi:hypothetical protein